MDTPPQCKQCNEYKKLYTKGLCYDCSMADKETPPPSIPDGDDVLSRTVRQAIALRTTGMAPDIYIPNQWVLSPSHCERLHLQVKHCAEQCDEAVKGNLGKVLHLQASLEELRLLIPGGAK